MNANPQLAKIEKSEDRVAQALEQYFNGGQPMAQSSMAQRSLNSGTGQIGTQSSVGLGS